MLYVEKINSIWQIADFLENSVHVVVARTDQDSQIFPTSTSTLHEFNYVRPAGRTLTPSSSECNIIATPWPLRVVVMLESMFRVLLHLQQAPDVGSKPSVGIRCQEIVGVQYQIIRICFVAGRPDLQASSTGRLLAQPHHLDNLI
jgi:hypothetical protein